MAERLLHSGTGSLGSDMRKALHLPAGANKRYANALATAERMATPVWDAEKQRYVAKFTMAAKQERDASDFRHLVAEGAREAMDTCFPVQ